MRNKIKIIENFSKKVLCEIKKSYLCTRKTTGNGVERKERGFAKFFERMIQSKSER